MTGRPPFRPLCRRTVSSKGSCTSAKLQPTSAAPGARRKVCELRGHWQAPLVKKNRYERKTSASPFERGLVRCPSPRPSARWHSQRVPPGRAPPLRARSVGWRGGLRRPSGCGDGARGAADGARRRDDGVLRERRDERIVGAIHPAHQERSRAECPRARGRAARDGVRRRRLDAGGRVPGRAVRRSTDPRRRRGTRIRSAAVRAARADAAGARRRARGARRRRPASPTWR